MANEKRLIDAYALLYEYCQANGCNEVIDEVCPNCFTAGLIANSCPRFEDFTGKK